MSLLEGDSVFGTAATWAIVLGAVVAFGGYAAVGTLQPLVAGVAVMVAGFGLLFLDTLAAPTFGKALFVLGIALLVSPLAVESVPGEVAYGGIVVLALAGAERREEVRPW
ncbi:hypothetical protein [Haloarcula pellucida]|uniref:Uncharacterized protein n=1 Tax=Haloarcula pellucida TaxID=1427151 RepID=A0A830GLL7_9EURY|nr:hypothetical protein [Halomicroarcula pellucida]MBX0348686.1 hypothetical protein [Halomicroarcula pellucida]GGN92206.1 hypothetical protein GCM10009030_16230 [Halomicroarcula pellucida]